MDFDVVYNQVQNKSASSWEHKAQRFNIINYVRSEASVTSRLLDTETKLPSLIKKLLPHSSDALSINVNGASIRVAVAVRIGFRL